MELIRIVGNVKQINQTSYVYDALGRLRSWTETSQPGSYSTTDLGLDTFGNRLFETYSFCGTDTNGVRHCGGSDIALRQIAGTTNHYLAMAYDAAGT